jgi:biotin carboxyl carrier protein
MAEEVRAPLAGSVLEILVEIGARVEEDDELLVTEALKTENAIAAPCGGPSRGSASRRATRWSKMRRWC